MKNLSYLIVDFLNKRNTNNCRLIFVDKHYLNIPLLIYLKNKSIKFKNKLFLLWKNNLNDKNKWRNILLNVLSMFLNKYLFSDNLFKIKVSVIKNIILNTKKIFTQKEQLHRLYNQLNVIIQEYLNYDPSTVATSK